MIVAVDFDGTCVKHRFPEVGEEVPHAVRVLRRLVDAGHKLILWTMRSDGIEKEGDVLSDAVKWFEENGITLFGVNSNPDQHSWTQSPKQYAHLYIDDAALGCPLVLCEGDERPFVDWIEVERILEDLKVIS